MRLLALVPNLYNTSPSQRFRIEQWESLQYMTPDIPTVCSPVGVNADIITDFKNSFLANTEDGWIEKLTRPMRSAQVRKQLGQAGRTPVEDRYSAFVQARHVYNIFEFIISKASISGAPVQRMHSTPPGMRD
jgi:hypothetical protein